MDIVSRLKQYLESRQVSVTQFADMCGIPRPSASQLLSGRNKKVSDEVISKIHQTFPSLPMLWLLFGEGEMAPAANIETSEPQTAPSQPEIAEQEPDSQAGEMEISFATADAENSPEKSGLASEPIFTDPHEDDRPYYGQPPSRPYDIPSEKPRGRGRSSAGSSAPASGSYTFTTDTRKRVMSIVVYYDDNSFESFIPDPSRRTPFAR